MKNHRYMRLTVLIIFSLMISFLFQLFFRGWIIKQISVIMYFIKNSQGDIWIICIAVITVFVFKQMVTLVHRLHLNTYFKISFDSQEVNFDNDKLKQITNWISLSRSNKQLPRHLSQYLKQLFFEIMAFRCHLTPETAERQLNAGTLEVPREIASWLQPEQMRDGACHSNRSRLLFWRKKLPVHEDVELDTIIEFLEYQMDVRRKNEYQ